MVKSKGVVTVIVAAGLLLGCGASAAFAATATTAGAQAFSSNANHTINAKDTANDSQFVSAWWRSQYGSEGSIANKNGFNTTVALTVLASPEYISQVRACRSNTVGPMTCGNWS